MPSEITAKVGNAAVVRLGHTEQKDFGNNPTQAKRVGATGPTDLKTR